MPEDGFPAVPFHHDHRLQFVVVSGALGLEVNLQPALWPRASDHVDFRRSQPFLERLCCCVVSSRA